MIMTNHARDRVVQRSIPQVVLDLLMDFGSVMRCEGSADRLFFDKAAKRRAERSLDKTALETLRRWHRVYLVLSDEGAVITAAHRTGRFRRQ